jgi:hypothetical protein
VDFLSCISPLSKIEPTAPFFPFPAALDATRLDVFVVEEAEAATVDDIFQRINLYCV